MASIDRGDYKIKEKYILKLKEKQKEANELHINKRESRNKLPR